MSPPALNRGRHSEASPGSSPEREYHTPPEQSPLNPQTRLPLISTRVANTTHPPTLDQTLTHDQVLTLDQALTLNQAPTATIETPSDHGLQPSPAALMPPPPPPSRESSSRFSVAESPGGSAYPAPVTASHPVDPPALQDALHDLTLDSGAAGLPSAEPSRSPTAHRATGASPRPSPLSERHSPSPIGRTRAASSGNNPFFDENRRPPSFSASTPSRTSPRIEAQLDGVPAYPEDAQPAPAAYSPPMALGPHETHRYDPRLTATAAELSVMNDAGHTAQLVRSEPACPGLERGVTYNTCSAAALAEGATMDLMSNTKSLKAEVEDVEQAQNEAVAYPNLGAARPSLVDGGLVERLDSTAESVEGPRKRISEWDGPWWLGPNGKGKASVGQGELGVLDEEEAEAGRE
ncbi:hypothetical protein LTR08_002268 [Meristemomyces frigidus]|nr:hypothetical protein LTR08_002268 [Meristemomyces frigidus]